MRFKQNSSKPKGHRISTAEHFRTTIYKEKLRADRYGGHFSIIVIEKNGYGSSTSFRNGWVASLENRVRPSDEIGWIDDARIGVMLPDTSREGAEKLFTDISRLFGIPPTENNFGIFSYPNNIFDDFSSRNAPETTEIPAFPAIETKVDADKEPIHSFSSSKLKSFFQNIRMSNLGAGSQSRTNMTLFTDFFLSFINLRVTKKQ